MINKFIVLFRHRPAPDRSDTRRDIVTRYCAARLIRGNKFFIPAARLSDTNEFDIQLNNLLTVSASHKSPPLNPTRTVQIALKNGAVVTGRAFNPAVLLGSL